MFETVLFGIAGIVSIIAANAIYNRFFHSLARIPGPLLASITPLWLAWQCMNNRRPTLDLELHNKYGSIVRITPDEIIFSNPEYFKTIYGAMATRKWNRSRFLTDHNREQPNYERLNLLNEVDMDKLRLQRRLIGPIYSLANVKKHEQHIDNTIRLWDARLKALNGTILDMYHELELLCVDLLSELTFADPFGAIERGNDGDHMKSTAKRWSWLGWVGYVPWWCNFQYKLMEWNVPFAKFELPFPVMGWALKKMIQYKAPDGLDEEEDARAGWTQRSTIIDTSTSKAETHTEQVSLEDVALEPATCIYDDLRRMNRQREEMRSQWVAGIATTNIGAGIDTTTWTLATFIKTVCENPSVYQKLRSELDNAVVSGLIGKGVPASYDAVAALPYLQACMREAMRLWPNVAVSLGRLVPEEGITIDGYYIPAGCVVGMQSKALSLNKDVFGSNAAEFDPGRWLTASKEHFNEMENKNFAFGGPSRKCVGMHLAWVAMAKILANLFLNFDVKVLNELNGPAGPGGHKWVEKGTFPTMWEGMEANIEPR